MSYFVLAKTIERFRTSEPFMVIEVEPRRAGRVSEKKDAFLRTSF
jgi:hypothetical protein